MSYYKTRVRLSASPQRKEVTHFSRSATVTVSTVEYIVLTVYTTSFLLYTEPFKALVIYAVNRRSIVVSTSTLGDEWI